MSIRINEKNRTIEINKTFSSKASIFGTSEYDDLQKVRKDYPNYCIKVVKSKSSNKSNSYSVSYVFMENYISKHDDDKYTIMNEYKNLRGLSDEAIEMGFASCTYEEIKKWFLAKYPKIGDFLNNREQTLKALDNKNA